MQDFFKPGVREIADILPPRLARLLLRRAERSPRLASAHVGMKVRTTTVSGYLRVWLLARLRPWRRRTYRYQLEQAASSAGSASFSARPSKGETALASEIAELARLIKGYGDTHARGPANYARIVETLVEPALAGDVVPAGRRGCSARGARGGAGRSRRQGAWCGARAASRRRERRLGNASGLSAPAAAVLRLCAGPTV